MRKIEGDTALAFELANPTRKRILTELEGGAKRHANLKNALGISASEVTRHCRRLAGSGLLDKDGGMFRITGVGRAALEELRDLEFISGMRDFLEGHDLNQLPGEMNNVGAMRKAEMVTGTMNVLEAVSGVNTGALDYVNCMIGDMFGPLVMEHSECLGRGIAMNILLPAGARIPDEYWQYRTLDLEFRCLPEVPMALFLSDNRGVWMVRRHDGEMDYSVAFTGSDDEFLSWCEAVFYRFWVRATLVSP